MKLSFVKLFGWLYWNPLGLIVLELPYWISHLGTDFLDVFMTNQQLVLNSRNEDGFLLKAPVPMAHHGSYHLVFGPLKHFHS